MKPDGGIFWGKMIVGVSTLMFVFVLISGIIIWIPRSTKALKNSLKISVNKGWKRFWYDLHIAGGLYTFIFLLALSLTGLTWSFSWYRTGFFKVFGVEMQEKGELRMENGEGKKRDMKEKERSEKEGENRKGRNQRKGETQSLLPSKFSPLPSPYALWQKVYEQLKVQNPDYKQITVSNGTANVSFNRFGNQRASDRYSFNPRNGEITETTLYKDLDNSGKIRGWIFSVHVGSWGGMFTRILSFIASLLGATLPLTGYYLWIKKEIARSARKRRK